MNCDDLELKLKLATSVYEDIQMIENESLKETLEENLKKIEHDLRSIKFILEKGTPNEIKAVKEICQNMIDFMGVKY